jgi:hypothetical protein
MIVRGVVFSSDSGVRNLLRGIVAPRNWRWRVIVLLILFIVFMLTTALIGRLLGLPVQFPVRGLTVIQLTKFGGNPGFPLPAIRRDVRRARVARLGTCDLLRVDLSNRHRWSRLERAPICFRGLYSILRLKFPHVSTGWFNGEAARRAFRSRPPVVSTGDRPLSPSKQRNCALCPRRFSVGSQFCLFSTACVSSSCGHRVAPSGMVWNWEASGSYKFDYRTFGLKEELFEIAGGICSAGYVGKCWPISRGRSHADLTHRVSQGRLHYAA